MKAAIYRETGAPDVLRVEDVPDPVAGADDVLIRVEAISVEGGDMIGRRVIEPGEPSRVLGYSAAGEVLAVGSAANCFSVGQKVTTFNSDGSHAELRAVPAATCWAVPDSLDLGVAAVIPCGPGTAALALALGGLTSGQTVLVQGAAGGVGIAAVQLAAAAGARVIGTGSNPATLAQLKEYGLSDAILIGDGPTHEQVRKLVGDGLENGVDLLIDNVGGPALTDGLRALKDGGHGVVVGVYAGSDQPIGAWELLSRRLTVHGCFLGAVMHEPAIHAMVADLLAKAKTGTLKVPIDSTFQLSDVVTAHLRGEERGRIGRVIICP